MKKTVVLLIALTIFSGCAKKDPSQPRVVTTMPQNRSVDIDPSLNKISVTFNEEMMDNSWSWSMENQDTFPKTTGSPYYVDGNTRNILPVQLQPGKEYVIWVNTSNNKNFKDKNGNPAAPFKFTFKTKKL